MAKNEEVKPPSAEAHPKAEAETVPLDSAKAETDPVPATPVAERAPRSRRGLVIGAVIGGALLWSALAFGGGFVAGNQFGDDILPASSSEDVAEDGRAGGPGDGRGPGGFRPHFGHGDRPGGPDRDRQEDTAD